MLVWIVLALVVGNLVGVIVGALVPERHARCTVPDVMLASLGALGVVGWFGPWVGVSPRADGVAIDLSALVLLGALAPVVALHLAAQWSDREPAQPQGAG